MKIILKDDVIGLGDIGEMVSVKAGYARNYLIPQGVALEAETASAKVIAHHMRQIEAKKKRLKAAAQTEADRLGALTVELNLRVGSAGRVFGSLGTRDIAEALAKMGVLIDRRRIILHEPIRKVGLHHVQVKLHADVQTQLNVQVNEVQATKEEEERETQLARQMLESKPREKEHSKEENKDAQEEEKTAE